MKLSISSQNRRIFAGFLALITTAATVQTSLAADAQPTIPIIVKDTTSNIGRSFWPVPAGRVKTSM